MHSKISGRPRFATLALLLLALLPAVFADSACAKIFTIQDYHSDIVVNENSSIEVTETIEVYFHDSRHGIYREIPYRYVTDLGDKMVMPIRVKSVTREDGRAWKYKVSYPGDVVNIRIGDADRYVDGRQVYVIKYTVENAILFLEDHDELYWNVTGNYWLADINQASATIRLNTNKTTSQLTGDCYTGAYGSSESACDFEKGHNEISFRTNKALLAREGLTVDMGWDKGIVQPPTKWQRFMWAINLQGNWVFLVPIAVFIYMFSLWYRKGRDPKVREAITVMYEPPQIGDKPLTPAQSGVLIDESLDQRDVTASLIGLAAKGYLELREIQEGEPLTSGSKDYTLIKLKSPDSELSGFERALMADVFTDDSGEAKVSDMKNKFYTKLPKLRKIMFEELVSLKFFATSPLKVKSKYMTIGLGVLLLGTFLLYKLSPYDPWKGVFSGILSGIAIMGFSGAMPVKTRRGALAHMNILGFQEFMNRADKDRIKRMGEHVFYEYLPYAIALDVVDNWVKAFAGILTQPPHWYVPIGSATAFSAQQFTKSITGAASHLGSTMFSAPRSSGGSGGGGSSGGGGGGGGGGSW